VVPTTVALRLVGFTTKLREGDTTMAEGQRMTAGDVVAQVRDGRLEDFVKEAVVLVCYKAEASPGLVGGQTIRSTNGRS
jgi:hypothetical protein